MEKLILGFALLSGSCSAVAAAQPARKSRRKFLMLLALTVALLFSTGVEVRAIVSGTPSLARHYDLSTLTNLDFYRQNCQIGDLNNDGLIDYLVYSNSKRMAAFADDGAGGLTKLWEYTTPVGGLPEPPEKYHYKYTIWDIDDDGQAEVLGVFASTSGKLELRIINGYTGYIENYLQTNINNPTSDDDINETRCKVTVANFRGLAKPRDIVLLTENDSVGEIWVYDDSLNLLWDTTGDARTHIYAHYAWTDDIDGDGKDELLANWIFDDDGTKGAWLVDSSSMPEWMQHLDRGYIGDLVASNPGVELLTSHEYYEARMHDVNGNLLWQVPKGHNDDKLIVAGEFSSAYSGPEVTTYNATSKNDTYRCENGSEIADIALVDSSSSMAVDWDGDRTKDEAYKPHRGGYIWDPMDGDRIYIDSLYNNDAYTLNGDSSSRASGRAADVYGDNREEIIVCDDDEILVYTNSDTNPDPQLSPWGTATYKLLIANQMSDVHVERAFWPVSSPGPVISGHVLESDLTPIEGALVSADNDGGYDITDTSGYYALSVPNNWSGTVTPTKLEYAFEPNSIVYANVTSDQSAQDYTGTYVPDTTPPEPNPTTWATVPYDTGSSSIAMAATASDVSGVEYYFACTAGGGHDSGWQNGDVYEDTGLVPNTQYSYQVRARDKAAAQNTTGWSTAQSATTGPPGPQFADSETTVDGTVTSGDYTDTHHSNNTYEAIEEDSTTGSPSSRISYLEHKWTINALGIDTESFYVEAYHTSNSEGDDFVFAYSTDDSNYIDMLTVTKTSDDDSNQSYELPGGISGTVYIRVMDTDRTGGNSSKDTIYIDRMYILSEGGVPQYTITASADANGTIEPSGEIIKNPGEDQQFTATANARYGVQTWYLDGNDVQNGGSSYTLNNIQANHTVHVTFEPLPLDDFNDNKRSAMWRLYEDDHENNRLGEVNQRLEMTASGDGSDLVALYVANGWSFDVGENFAVNVDFHYGDISAQDGWVGMTVADNNDNYISISAGSDSNERYYYYETTVDSNTVFEQELRDTNDGTLYVWYDSNSNQLYLSHIGYGSENAYTWQTTADPLHGQWTSGVDVTIGGGSDSVALGSGEAYLDNFEIFGAELAGWPPVTDLDGDGFIGWGDVGVISENWLVTDPNEGDINNDGTVNLRDFAELGLAW